MHNALQNNFEADRSRVGARLTGTVGFGSHLAFLVVRVAERLLSLRVIDTCNGFAHPCPRACSYRIPTNNPNDFLDKLSVGMDKAQNEEED
jgi:hypothetical protein